VWPRPKRIASEFQQNEPSLLCDDLGALGYDARPAYIRQTAGKLRKQGMDTLVSTLEKLAECMAQIIRGSRPRMWRDISAF
jgi:hypothetical protein